jgi:hypothetical protein
MLHRVRVVENHTMPRAEFVDQFQQIREFRLGQVRGRSAKVDDAGPVEARYQPHFAGECIHE